MQIFKHIAYIKKYKYFFSFDLNTSSLQQISCHVLEKKLGHRGSKAFSHSPSFLAVFEQWTWLSPTESKSLSRPGSYISCRPRHPPRLSAKPERPEFRRAQWDCFHSPSQNKCLPAALACAFGLLLTFLGTAWLVSFSNGSQRSVISDSCTDSKIWT